MATTKDAARALGGKRKKSKHALFLERKGITSEKAQPGHSVNSIGRDREGRWWGWSHRAIHDFSTRDQAVRFAESVS